MTEPTSITRTPKAASQTTIDVSPAAPLELFPAVDIQGGRAVQLVQGVASSEKVFGTPLDAALRWQDEGARWIHLVDLDAAFGRGDNVSLIADLIKRMTISVELSGGIRDDESLRRALDTGCARVNIGTAALENPEWVESIIAEHGDRIAIGLDVKGTRLAARGWTCESGDLVTTIARMDAAGAKRFVVTDVASDGMLTGPNLELLGSVCARTRAKVVASGGISSLNDIRQLAGLTHMGVEGAIIGTALYVGSFTLSQALEAAQPRTAA